MASLSEIMEALADQIRDTAGTATPDLNVYPLLIWNPTPPAVDVYPADPSQDALAFGRGNRGLFLTVRARVNTADSEGAQELLLSMMDPDSSTSIGAAIESDRTLGGTVSSLALSDDSPSDYGAFVDPGPDSRALLGCTWRVRVIP